MADYDGAPPTDPDVLDLPPEPKSWPKVIGILSIIWASIGLLCAGCGVGLMPVWRGMIEDQLKGAPPPPSMVFGTVDYALMAVGVALTFVLLAAGIATVMRKPAGRALHLAYGALSLPLLAANIWNAMQKSAAMAQWAKDYPDNPIAQSQASGGQMGELIGYAFMLCFGLAWPLFCLVWFGLVKRSTAEMTAGLDNPAA